MEILIIAHYNLTSELSGGKNRILSLAKALARFSSVKILHRGKNLSNRSQNLHFIGYMLIPPLDNSYLLSELVSQYISIISPSFYKKLKSSLNNVDVVQIEQPYTAIPAFMIMKLLRKKPLIVLDSHNVDFMAAKSKLGKSLFASFATLITLPYIFLCEKFAVSKAHLILCVSEEDCISFLRFYKVPLRKIVVIPNGVDLEKFERAPLIPGLKDKKTIFFHGLYSWYPNLEAAQLIIDYIAPRVPEGFFLLAGSHLPQPLIEKTRKMRNVKYLGYLRNLESWIKSSKVCIAPILRGGGTRLKILEYAAASKPIVATFKAVEGLGIINKVHGLFYREVDEQFIEGIRRVLNDDRLAEELGKNAYSLAKRYDWRVIGEKLYNVYKKVLQDC